MAIMLRTRAILQFFNGVLVLYKMGLSPLHVTQITSKRLSTAHNYTMAHMPHTDADTLYPG